MFKTKGGGGGGKGFFNNVKKTTYLENEGTPNYRMYFQNWSYTYHDRSASQLESGKSASIRIVDQSYADV